MAVSFNGGKDCTVLLHMIDFVARWMKIRLPDGPSPFLTIYFEQQDTFTEIVQFMTRTEERLGY